MRSAYGSYGRLPAIGFLSLAMTAVLPQVGRTADPVPLGSSERWNLVFSDEFDTAPSAAKWTRCYWWDDNGCTNLGNNELQWYMPNNVAVSDGSLILQAKEEQVRGYKGRTYQNTSGMVTSGRDYLERSKPDRFSTTYGYFEMRAKMPAGKGLWSAFWLLPSTQNSKPEIDVVEVLGDEPDKMNMHVHYLTMKSGTEDAGSESTVDNMTEGFHVYGLDWREDAIVWYFDGKEKWRYTQKDSIPKEPMYILLNLAVGGEWPGAPDARTVFPAEYAIDYVRVWKSRE